MPVCSRCTGVYIASFSYFIYVYYYFVEYTNFLILAALIMIMPMFIDGLSQFLNLRESNNIIRLLTGLIGGIGFGILVKALKFTIIATLIY